MLIIVIGDNWLSERLSHPTDFVRLEIELALQQEIKMIPVLVGEAEMPAASELPESSIRDIVYLQALVVPAGPGRRRQLDLLVAEVRELFA